MSDAVITVEQLSKRYRLGVIGATSLRDSAERCWHRLRGRDPEACMATVSGSQAPSATVKTASAAGGAPGQQGRGVVWALRDASFEVKQGEVLGIIGRNGAGKSTLLKILSRITTPTSGRAVLRGRVGSLLEVGTGFHPELTGRENIFLNGAILGMNRKEIRRRFDEIVAFSGVEDFVDTPVKRYSSGMMVRLAFSVAAHLEAEIMVIDEVLAVGDLAFQRRCLGKMQEEARSGRTVLFVSHNMGAVSRLCSRCIMIEDGRITRDGDPDSVVSAYMSEDVVAEGVRTWKDDASGQPVSLREVRICQPAGQVCARLDIRKPFFIEVAYDVLQALPEFGVSLDVKTVDGVSVIHPACLEHAGRAASRTGPAGLVCHFPAYTLNGGSYYLSVFGDIPQSRTLFRAENSLAFEVAAVCERMARYDVRKWPGVVGPLLVTWSQA